MERQNLCSVLHNERYCLFLTVHLSICGNVSAGLSLLAAYYEEAETNFNAFGEWATEYRQNTILDQINVYYFH